MKTKTITLLKQIPGLLWVKRVIWKLLFGRYKNVDYWLRKALVNRPAYVLNIGANDGKMVDPFYTLNQANDQWTVILVEPVPYVYEKLRQNFGHDSRFITENAAINDGSLQTFYYVDEKARTALTDLPHWYDKLGSFDRSVIVGHLDGVLEPYILSLEVTGFTLNQLLAKHGVTSIYALQVDTEGYDWKIIRQLDFATQAPDVILFEYKHLEKEELAEAKEKLLLHYHVFEIDSDYLCLHHERHRMSARDIKRLYRWFPVV
jgi:FkbM family methyltransferase